MLSPLQLKHYSFTQVAIRAVEDGSAEAEVTFEHQFRCGSKADNPLIWRADLQVTMSGDNAKPFTYSGVICIRGIFEIHPDFPEVRRQELIRVNGASLLYGAIREMILNITSRSLKGPLILPTVSFQHAQGDKEPRRFAKSKKSTGARYRREAASSATK